MERALARQRRHRSGLKEVYEVYTPRHGPESPHLLSGEGSAPDRCGGAARGRIAQCLLAPGGEGGSGEGAAETHRRSQSAARLPGVDALAREDAADDDRAIPEGPGQGAPVLTALVVDASVAFKWTQPGAGESGAEAALAVLQEHLDGRISVHVPSLLFYEVANGLLLGRAKPAIGTIEQALRCLFGLSLQIVPPDPDGMMQAARMSRSLGLTVYDATYLVLAGSLDCGLATADRRLARRAGRMPGIRLVE
jgi:predicted nucleic acid-binding protein